MFARILNDKIIEQDARSHDGEEGWIQVDNADIGKPLIFDTGTGEVRPKTELELTVELESLAVEDAWFTLRQTRDEYLDGTDRFALTDRPDTPNMVEYREYLRDLPGSYDDDSILEQDAVLTFDQYVESL